MWQCGGNYYTYDDYTLDYCIIRLIYDLRKIGPLFAGCPRFEGNPEHQAGVTGKTVEAVSYLAKLIQNKIELKLD